MKSLFSTLLTSSLLATGIAASLMSAPASATSCSVSNVILGGMEATACRGPISGNDTGNGGTLGNLLNQQNLFDQELAAVGITGETWSLAGKSDENSILNADKGEVSNSWLSFDSALNTNTFVISLKTSNSYSAYLFTNYNWQAPNALEGIFNTIGVELNGNGKAGKALSHASLFVANVKTVTPPSVQEVPEPATVMGLGLVFGGLVASRRRKAH